MNGEQVTHLMRKYKVTIRELKERSGFTLKRIREVRSKGLSNPRACRDWYELITGIDPGQYRGNGFFDRDFNE